MVNSSQSNHSEDTPTEAWLDVRKSIPEGSRPLCPYWCLAQTKSQGGSTGPRPHEASSAFSCHLKGRANNRVKKMTRGSQPPVANIYSMPHSPLVRGQDEPPLLWGVANLSTSAPTYLPECPKVGTMINIRDAETIRKQKCGRGIFFMLRVNAHPRQSFEGSNCSRLKVRKDDEKYHLMIQPRLEPDGTVRTTTRSSAIPDPPGPASILKRSVE